MLEFDTCFRIESGGGLVHDENLWIVKQRAAEAEALGHALGEFVGKAVGERDEVGEIHHLVDALAALSALVAEGAGVEVEVLQHGHVVVVAEVIRHPADEFPHLRRVVDDIDPADLGMAHGRVVEAGEDTHGGGFSRTVGTDEAADRAVWDFEGNTVYGLKGAEEAVEIMDCNGGVAHENSNFKIQLLRKRWFRGFFTDDGCEDFDEFLGLGDEIFEASVDGFVDGIGVADELEPEA